MNSLLELLQPYPFERLAALKADCSPPSNLAHIALSIGEPKHAPPDFVLEVLRNNLSKVSHYAATKGLAELREAMSRWAERRFSLPNGAVDSEKNILPVNGTREALFAFAQAVIDHRDPGAVFMPNPFYQIYEGAAVLAGAEPVYLNCEAASGYRMDFDSVSSTQWNKCKLLYLCTPGNPTGAVLSLAELEEIIALSDRYGFVIASDECYSELYFDESAPPPGLLQACAAMGRHNFERCVAFHSLSKRSNLPGLRSGFVAGDAKILQKFLLYRTYHGCAMPLQTQLASAAAWGDESHVFVNRELYRIKFSRVTEILREVLEIEVPAAGFYLWPRVPGGGIDFARKLFAEQNVTVLPGAYLSRATKAGNPGEDRVRMALVAEPQECVDAAERIRNCLRASSF